MEQQNLTLQCENIIPQTRQRCPTQQHQLYRVAGQKLWLCDECKQFEELVIKFYQNRGLLGNHETEIYHGNGSG